MRTIFFSRPCSPSVLDLFSLTFPVTMASTSRPRRERAVRQLLFLHFLLLSLGSSSAFSPPVLPRPTKHEATHRRHRHRSASASVPIVAFAVATTSSPAGIDAAEVARRQARAENAAKSCHDNYAMNALFVNLPERPDPTPCSFHKKSSLPADFPPGCLLRIGPNGATTEEGFLDGDGMVHCITMPPNGGGAPPMYSSTYIETTGRKLEREKARETGPGGGRPTFGGTLGAAPRGLPMLANLVRNGITFGTLAPQKDTCNTALAESGGRVLALMEQCPPSELEVSKTGRVNTVASSVRLDGAVPVGPINGGSLGAHGRTDPETGERIHVSYRSDLRPYVRVDTFSSSTTTAAGGGGWDLARSVGIDLPVPVMVHDCALTERHVVVLDFPLTVRPARFVRDRFPVEYEPTNGARIGLVPRRNGEDTVWFEVENCVVLHVANAYENAADGTVVVHAFRSVPSGDASYILDYTPAYLHEWVLDLNSGVVVSERCLNPDVMVEFPQVEDSSVGRKAGSCYGLVSTSIGGPMAQFKTPEKAVLLDGVVRMSLEDRVEDGVRAGDVLGRFDLPRGWHSVSEPTLVAKTGAEGTYVLLVATSVPEEGRDEKDHVAMALDGRSMKSQLLVLDGDDLGKGPLTAIDLPHHVNYGLHSLFLEWDKMK